MKSFKAVLFSLISLPLLCQSTKIGTIDFHPLDDSKPNGALFGQLQVFENNIANEGKTIMLYVEVLPAKSNKKRKDPMFVLMGGPGQASSHLISFFSTIFNQINKERDIVFVDQRGTGKSNPLRMSITYDSLQDYLNDPLMQKGVVKKTYQLLSSKNDLEKYGTLNAAIDMESVRVAMGYDKINIYGTSYGTRLGLVYINKYPDNVRTATLKGLVPDDLVIPLDFAKDSQKGLELLIEHCNTDKLCSTAFPNFEEEFYELMSLSYPIKVDVNNPETGVTETVQLTRESVALVIRSLLSVPTYTQQIPFLISEFSKGNHKVLAELVLKIKLSNSKGIYTGMRLCVICYEDYPKILETEVYDSKDTFLGDIWTNRVTNACKIWNPTSKKVQNIEYKKQDIPVLLISGERDATTPRKYGDSVLKYFKNGKHITVNNAGHSFDRMLDCIEFLINDFVISGSTQNLNLDCISSIKFPDFKLK